jgi:multisubunit Na+/H+ antiporter MnhC subunit
MAAVAWRRGSGEEEARAHLQSRLTTLFKLLFWCFVALMAFIFAAYYAYRNDRAWSFEPKNQAWVYTAFIIGVSIQAFIWRVILLRRKLSLDQLQSLDLTFVVGSTTIVAFCAFVSNDQRQSAYTCLIYTCWTVLTRALIVPSTGRRTAIVTALAMVPFGIATLYLTHGHVESRTRDARREVLLQGREQHRVRRRLPPDRGGCGAPVGVWLDHHLWPAAKGH